MGGGSVKPQFFYRVMERELRIGDVVDGIYRSQAVYDATVIRPECLEYGRDGLNYGNYTVEVTVGTHSLLLERNTISNVRRAYQPGDWLAA